MVLEEQKKDLTNINRMLEEERDDSPHGNRAKETGNQNKENQVHIKKLREEVQERDKAKQRTQNNKTRDPRDKKGEER